MGKDTHSGHGSSPEMARRQVTVCDTNCQPCDVVALLERDAAPSVDLPVRIGAQHQFPVRLLAVRVPQEVADQRRRRLRQAHRDKGRVPSPRTLALLTWMIAITTVPAEQLTLAEALVLLRAPWQIEILFKLWKSQGQVDSWTSQQPWRILCEVYAKLLAMIVLQWGLLISCWQYPNRSLFKAARVWPICSFPEGHGRSGKANDTISAQRIKFM